MMGLNWSEVMSSWSAGVLRTRRSRHSAAFLRTMGRTVPEVCGGGGVAWQAGQHPGERPEGPQEVPRAGCTSATGVHHVKLW